MNNTELERRLRAHAERMKEHLSPFPDELEEMLMKKNKRNTSYRNPRRIIVLAVVAALLLGTTAFAAYSNRSGWFSSIDKEYMELPSQQELAEDIGGNAVVMESFANGYRYERGVVDNNEIYAEDLGLVRSFKSAHFSYEKDGNTVFLTQDCSGYETAFMGELVETIDGIGLYYHSYRNKIVPADYQLTEADKLAEERGELVFSYGSDSVQVTEVKSLHWLDGGMDTMLMQMGGELTAADLVEMAREILTQ